jgi:hypothetical protein
MSKMSGVEACIQEVLRVLVDTQDRTELRSHPEDYAEWLYVRKILDLLVKESKKENIIYKEGEWINGKI